MYNIHYMTWSPFLVVSYHCNLPPRNEIGTLWSPLPLNNSESPSQHSTFRSVLVTSCHHVSFSTINDYKAQWFLNEYRNVNHQWLYIYILTNHHNFSFSSGFQQLSEGLFWWPCGRLTTMMAEKMPRRCPFVKSRLEVVFFGANRHKSG